MQFEKKRKKKESLACSLMTGDKLRIAGTGTSPDSAWNVIWNIDGIYFFLHRPFKNLAKGSPTKNFSFESNKI